MVYLEDEIGTTNDFIKQIDESFSKLNIFLLWYINLYCSKQKVLILSIKNAIQFALHGFVVLFILQLVDFVPDILSFKGFTEDIFFDIAEFLLPLPLSLLVAIMLELQCLQFSLKCLSFVLVVFDLLQHVSYLPVVACQLFSAV